LNPPPITLLLELTVTVPATTPGNDTSWAAGSPIPASVNGRVTTAPPSDPNVPPWRLGPRKKKSPSIPHAWSSSNHTPAWTRKPLRKSLFSRPSVSSVVVPGAPRVPAVARGVPGDAPVTSAGTGVPDVA
jgi:hypothetical protein